MAWLDNSHLGQRQRKSFESKGLRAKNNVVLRFLHQVPILNILFHWYNSVHLFFQVTHKLNLIEKAIATSPLEKEEIVLPLLRELFLAKKYLSKPILKSIRDRLYIRGEILKRTLITKSGQFRTEDSQHELDEQPSLSSMDRRRVDPIRGNSDQCVKSIVQQQIDKAPLMPNKLYWCYPQVSFPGHQYSFFLLNKKPHYIYLRTSCHKLLQILLSNDSIPLCNTTDLRIDYHDWEGTVDSQLVCGARIKLPPSFNFCGQEVKQTAFWQQPRNLATLKKQDKNLQNYIHELFFLTTTHYEEFTQLLKEQSTPEVLNLMAMLEAEKRITIFHFDRPLPAPTN